EELLEFKLQKLWILVDLPKGHRAIEEGIDYDEVFAPVARIKAIRMFLAYASYMGFMVYQMDVKSAFLYGRQPLGFEDLDHPDKVYKVVKALYGLHQAPRAWYDTLANYLLCNGFQRGKIDQTLFIKRKQGHILLVQIYVDDIIFGSTKKELCDEFEKLMKDKFQMSSMGELTFFLGLQVQQKKKGIFISQDKYVHEILRKYNYTLKNSNVKSASTLTDLEKPLVQDGDAAEVDEHLYRSMIGSLMYLIASRPDIIFAYMHVQRSFWQCKKQTVVATSTTKAEYVARCTVLWTVALFPTMLNVSEPSTSPSHSPEPSPSHSPAPSIEYSPDHTTPTQPSPETEQHIPTPHDSPLHAVHSHRSDEGSLKLIELTNLVTKLSKRIGVLEDDLKKTKLTYNAAVTKLILRVKKLEFQVKTRKSKKRARVVLSEDDKDVEDDSSKQGRKSDAKVQGKASTKTEPIIQEVTPTKKKDERKDQKMTKGKAIMTEPEPKKKYKKELEQERQWEIEEKGKELHMKAKSTKEIDWNDPSVIRYHALKMKPKTVAQARRNMVKYLKNQGNYKISDFKGILKKKMLITKTGMKEVSKRIWNKRKQKSLPRKSTRSTVKNKRLEEETEKEDLKGYLDIVPREEFAEDVESLSTKYPIVDWKTCVLTENFIQDVMTLQASQRNIKCFKAKGYDLMIWGDLHTLFEPDEEDEIWKNQHEYNLISWRLCDFCGIHILLMQNGIAIHMLTEKKYPSKSKIYQRSLKKRWS
ncbi:putative ribonuclease H-like domain-containing protein, partial [Tanacetum coccineum]